MVRIIKSFSAVLMVCCVLLSSTGVSVNATESYTIRFVDEDGAELQSSEWEYGETPSYSGETPTKEDDDWYSYEFKGWTPEITEATGDAIYTAAYTATPIEYIAKFIVGPLDQTLAEIPYTVETEEITPPPIPEKVGYTGEWQGYYPSIKLVSGGMKFYLEYWPKIWLDDTFADEIGYRESLTFHAYGDVPEGAEIHWYLNDKLVGTGLEYTVENPTDSYTIYVEVIDKDGKLYGFDERDITIRNGFSDKIQWLFWTIFEGIIEPTLEFISYINYLNPFSYIF